MTYRKLDPLLLEGVGKVSDKWQFKFRFFAKHGVPGLTKTTPETRAEFAKLSLNQRRILAFNFPAFFFSFIYLLILGLWKKAITLCVLGVVISAITWQLTLPQSVEFGLSVALVAFVAARANMYYYDLMVRVEQTWWL
ncbi:DUF2628 domain-containing protein [Tomitella biformata]|uniref:DUF2628 domain-containing protein n=1 Tax=Tomitella biformata TaxID=630403 RepID=UPI000467B472|nr:DUF2628 domain-containing protein [Tomitella biformata]